MPDLEDIWIPLVDEPIGSIVEQIQRENPDISRLVESPHRILAFRTFAYIRTGLLLGIPAAGGSFFGSSLQQRLPVRTLSFLFAALLVAIAVDMLIR